ncbi:MAG TPA: hypothetical protein VMJ12_00670 [Candidatus Acidoferrales bacterium]|nr:hypothetical protein [Candidatus Acidoferrales bacterium]
MKPDEDISALLLKSNLELLEQEKKGELTTSLGPPASIKGPKDFISMGCLRIEA